MSGWRGDSHCCCCGTNGRTGLVGIDSFSSLEGMSFPSSTMIHMICRVGCHYKTKITYMLTRNRADARRFDHAALACCGDRLSHLPDLFCWRLSQRHFLAPTSDHISPDIRTQTLINTASIRTPSEAPPPVKDVDKHQHYFAA